MGLNFGSIQYSISQKVFTIFDQKIEVGAVQKYVNLVDLFSLFSFFVSFSSFFLLSSFPTHAIKREREKRLCLKGNEEKTEAVEKTKAGERTTENASYRILKILMLKNVT